MTTELRVQPELRPPLWWLPADRAARVIRMSVFRRKYQLQELRDEVAELHGTVYRLMQITETVLDALADNESAT
jgi:hypothetical protein